MPAQQAELAQAHYAQRAALTNAVAGDATRRWATVDSRAILDSWQKQLPPMTAAVTAAQYAAAQTADPYVQSVAAAQGAGLTAPDGVLIAASFAGVASDGRDLQELLLQPAFVTLRTIGDGAPLTRAMAAGYVSLESIVRTQVADAGREADLVANTTHRRDGYVRLVVGATCNRCIILAGRWYPWSAGFERHPRCDCIMVPAPEGEKPPQSPAALYESMSPEQRSAAGWSLAEQKAIGLGANISSVTNIHGSGSLYTAGGRQFTRVGQGRGRRKRPRITPRQIFIEAGDDRDEAVRLLRLHRYIH